MSPRPTGGVHVVAVLDASEEIVEPFIASRVDSLEKARTLAGPSLSAVADVYRKGTPPTLKILKGVALAGLQAALPLYGFAMLGVPGLIGCGAAALALGAFGAARMAWHKIQSGRMHRAELPDPNWRGHRTYAIAPDRTAAADSPVVHRDRARKPKPAALEDLLTQNLHPTRTNVLYVAGHGLGYRKAAGMPAVRLGEAMREAVQDTGRKVDVVLMESCLMGNLEALNELRDVARIAVVSEETIDTDALPIPEMLADAARLGGTPEEIGRRMVDQAEATGKVQTLAAVDLEKMPDLMEALDHLGTALTAEMDAGRRGEIREAAGEAARFPRLRSLYTERALLRFADLEGFLSGLQERGLAPREAAAALQALDEAVVAEAAGKGYDDVAGSLSFQRRQGPLRQALIEMDPRIGRYGRLDLPEGWKGFLRRLN